MMFLIKLALLAGAVWLLTIGIGMGVRGSGSTIPVPSYFCPSGQHLVTVKAGLPECAR